jgi:hypothetical protein
MNTRPSRSQSSVSQEAPSSGPPLPFTGSPGAGSPASAALSVDSDFSLPVPPRFVAFAWRYHPLLRFAPRGEATPGAWTTYYRGARTACQGWRKRDLPGSWATLACMPRSQTPADRLPQASSGSAMLPSANLTTSAPPKCHFRGSITRPASTLCTLRSRGRPRTTQHSVPAGGQPLPGQDLHLLGRIEGFRHGYPST